MFDRSDAETYVVDQPGLTVDLIVWRRYRRRTPGLVEAVIDMNYGLAVAMTPEIPVGTTLRIPIDRPASSREIARVRLW